MVTIISVITEGFLIGKIANHSMTIPTRVRTSIVRIKPKIMGSFRVTEKKIMTSPPNITNSPWAKFIIEVEL